MTDHVKRLAEITNKQMRRDAEVAGVDVAARTVELAFSSEVEVERWYGMEVLSHDPGACDLSRLNDAAAVLWNHDWDDMRGVVESARIDSDRKGRAIVRISKSAAGDQLLQDIDDKIITKVSVGYLATAAQLQETRGDIDVWVITRWQPFEISFVSVPADVTVGVGRSADIPHVGSEPAPAHTSPHIEFIEPPQKTEASRRMDETEKQRQIDEARRAGVEAEQNRVRSIFEMGKEYKQEGLAAQAVREGKTPEDFQRMLLVHFNEHSKKPLDEQTRTAEIGLTPKEVRNFSIMRAVRAQIPGASKADVDAAGFERECSLAAEKVYGKQARGIIVPSDVLSHSFLPQTRALGIATDTGGNLVETKLMSGSFIELLRHRVWVMKRATILAGLVGNADIPRQNGTNTAYWLAEGGAPTSGKPAFDQIALTPNTLGALAEITRRLLQQATPDAETLVRNDLLKVMGLEIDRAAIYGTGANNMPTGVNAMSGINAVAFGTASKPTFAELVEMETAIALDDADVDGMSYAFNAGIRGYAKTTQRFPGTADGTTIWEPGKTVNGYDTNVSNQIASGDVFFGNWADLVIGMWGGLDLTVDPYSLSSSGGLRLVAFQDVDFAVRHEASFCVGR